MTGVWVGAKYVGSDGDFHWPDMFVFRLVVPPRASGPPPQVLKLLVLRVAPDGEEVAQGPAGDGGGGGMGIHTLGQPGEGGGATGVVIGTKKIPGDGKEAPPPILYTMGSAGESQNHLSPVCVVIQPGFRSGEKPRLIHFI